MHAILCSPSNALLAKLLSEPELMSVLMQSERSAPAAERLDLRKTWDALDIILSDRGRDPVLGDAVLGRSGKRVHGIGAFDEARVLDSPRVAIVAKALSALPANVVRKRYPALFGKTVHGNYGQEICVPDELKFIRDKVRETHEAEIADLEVTLTKVTQLYEHASREKRAMLLTVL